MLKYLLLKYLIYFYYYPSIYALVFMKLLTFVVTIYQYQFETN